MRGAQGREATHPLSQAVNTGAGQSHFRPVPQSITRDCPTGETETKNPAAGETASGEIEKVNHAEIYTTGRRGATALYSAVLCMAGRPGPVAMRCTMRGTEAEPIPAPAVHRMRELLTAGYAVQVVTPSRAAWHQVRGALLAALGLGRGVVL